jgi:hypothetical protein
MVGGKKILRRTPPCRFSSYIYLPLKGAFRKYKRQDQAVSITEYGARQKQIEYVSWEQAESEISARTQRSPTPINFYGWTMLRRPYNGTHRQSEYWYARKHIQGVLVDLYLGKIDGLLLADWTSKKKLKKLVSQLRRRLRDKLKEKGYR